MQVLLVAGSAEVAMAAAAHFNQLMAAQRLPLQVRVPGGARLWGTHADDASRCERDCQQPRSMVVQV